MPVPLLTVQQDGTFTKRGQAPRLCRYVQFKIRLSSEPVPVFELLVNNPGYGAAARHEIPKAIRTAGLAAMLCTTGQITEESVLRQDTKDAKSGNH